VTDAVTDAGTDPAAKPVERLPVSVLTGFLGSGKTTLLRELLRHPDFSETAVVINEFGEIGLDHLLVESAREDMVLLASGCLCCTISGDLVTSLRRLYQRRAAKEVPLFRRVVVETTGLADPAPILHTLMQDPMLAQVYRLDGVIATVDAVNGMDQLDRQMESVKQAAVADRLVLTKCDLAPETKVLEERLRGLNPAAPILKAVAGRIDPQGLFDAGLYNPANKSLDVRRWLKEEAYAAAPQGHHGHDHHDHEGGLGHEGGHGNGHAGLDRNRHDEHIRAFCLTRAAPLDWDKFADWVEMMISLHGANLLRIKGVLNVAEAAGPIAIHGVQHLFHPPVELPAWPDADRSSRLVFITRDIDGDTMSRSLTAFLGEDSAPA
jgi:G3E family GTPase